MVLPGAWPGSVEPNDDWRLDDSDGGADEVLDDLEELGAVMGGEEKPLGSQRDVGEEPPGAQQQGDGTPSPNRLLMRGPRPCHLPVSLTNSSRLPGNVKT